MFFGKRTGPVTWLVVGLGNPGPKYEWTRHNMGFLVVDELAERENIPVQRLKYKALTNTALIGGQSVLLMKPTTYMNLSGEAVGQAARFYKIPPERVLVISDDVALPQGKLRVRRSGSAGGHNGLKNIIAHLGTDQFPRIKVGVSPIPTAIWPTGCWGNSPGRTRRSWKTPSPGPPTRWLACWRRAWTRRWRSLMGEGAWASLRAGLLPSMAPAGAHRRAGRYPSGGCWRGYYQRHGILNARPHPTRPPAGPPSPQGKAIGISCMAYCRKLP